MKKILPNNLNQLGIIQLLPLIFIVIISAALIYLVMNQTGNFNLSGLKNKVASKMTKLEPFYSLALVGHPGAKEEVDLGSDKRTIFVPLAGECTIHLTSGDFKVSDDKCLNDPDATFSLPANSAGDDDATTYAVYVKMLDAKLAAAPECKKDTSGSYCPTNSMVVVRAQDQTFSSDVTKILEYVYLDLDGSGSVQRYYLFDEMLKGKVWPENTGKKDVYLRFYPQSTKDLEKQQEDPQN